MSATQPVKQTFFFDNEPVTKADLEILELYAKKSSLNLNSASDQMFRVSPECLTKGQYSELFKMLFEAAIAKQHPQHAHLIKTGEDFQRKTAQKLAGFKIQYIASIH